MKPKEYLSQIELFDVLIDQKIKEKEQLMKYDGVVGVNYEGDKVRTSPSREGMQVRIVEQIMQYEADINNLVDQFIDLKRKLIGQIQAIPKLEYKQLLFKRYVEYKRLEVIAVEMNYSYDWVTHAHGKALIAFGDLWKESLQ